MSCTNFKYPVQWKQWRKYEEEAKEDEKEDNTYDEMEDVAREGEVDDYIQIDESPEVVRQERVGEYDEERINAAITDTDEQFQQSPVLSNANESNDGSERTTQSTVTTELSSASEIVLCDRTFDVQLYLRDAHHRWNLHQERAQMHISCISPNFDIVVRVYCNSRSVETQTYAANGLFHEDKSVMHSAFADNKEDENRSIDCDFDEIICKGYLFQFPNVSNFPMQMTLSLSYLTKCSTDSNSSLFNVVNCHDNTYCFVVEIGLKFTCDNGLHECLEWFQNTPLPYSIRHNMWSINYIHFNYPFDTILHMMQTYVPIQHTILLDQVFAGGIDKEIFRFWQNHKSKSKLAKASKAQFVGMLDDIAIGVFGHNTNFYESFEDAYEMSSSSDENDESSNWETDKGWHFSNKNKHNSNGHWGTNKHDGHARNPKKSHERIVIVGSSAQGLDLITSDVDCCLLIDGADRYDRDSCIFCLTEFANFLKDIWILRSDIPQSKAGPTKHCCGADKKELPNSKTSTPKDNADLKKWKHKKEGEDVKECHETELQNQYYKLNVTTLFNAKVPIIKLYDPITSVSCDVGILMSDNSIKTTNYLRQLLNSCRDPRPTMLLICIKYWSYKRRINDAYRGFMNSYGYVLLAIKYLQVLQPPLLPVLETSYANYNPYSDSSFPIKPAFATIKPGECNKNNMYLTDLLHGFFEYYSYFDFSRGIVNVAEVGVSPKATTTHPYLSNGSKEFNDEWNSFVNPIHFHSLVVEDPFDKDNNVAKNVDHINLGIIRQEIIRAKNMFVEGKHWADICASKK